MRRISKDRVVKGLKYKTLTTARWAAKSPWETGEVKVETVEILQATAKTVVYKVGPYNPEIDSS